jgi:DNA-binding transcriptional LysR family regulator
MDVNFELYKIFYHAAKDESFSKAAAGLFISQSAVSQAIKNLEQKLGIRLFFRKTRNLQLTSEGKLLFTHIEQAFNLIKAAENKITAMQNLNSGEIRIGAGDTVCKYNLLPFLQIFNQQYPNIKIRVINRTSSQIKEILENGAIDFGVVTLPLSENVYSQNIQVQELFSVQDIFIASIKFSSLHEKPVEITELANYPLLMLERTSATRRNLDSFLRQNQINLAPEIELESVDLLVEFAKIGLGVAHVLRESAMANIRKGEVFEVKTNPAIPPRRLGIITLTKVPLMQAGSKFIELLKQKTGTAVE